MKALINVGAYLGVIAQRDWSSLEAFLLEPMNKVDGTRVKSLVIDSLYGAPVLAEENIIASTYSSSHGRW
jgi:hypothetical protein